MSNYPIVLAHGIARFDVFAVNLKETSEKLFGNNIFLRPILAAMEASGFFEVTSYFKDIVRFLKGQGFDAYATHEGFANHVEERAQDLKSQINSILRKTGAPKVHIIGHSMGGLDARYMIVEENMADKVSSLTTIGTPHLGTSLAQEEIDVGGGILLELSKTIFQLDLEGFRDLTEAACQAFNEKFEPFEANNSVVYQVYSGWQRQEKIFEPLKLAWDKIQRTNNKDGFEGANDGLVSRKSQEWHETLKNPKTGKEKHIERHTFPVEVDHLNEVGWWDWNELQGQGLTFSTLDSINEYETQIKNVYLDIAKRVNPLI